MAIVGGIKQKIQTVIDNANAATGKGDTDLTSAVNSLINNSEGEDIQLQEKRVVPSAEVQIITADDGFGGLSSVIVEAIPIDENTSSSPMPAEIPTEAEMIAILDGATADDVGAVYKYTGESGIYENGALYVIEMEG